MAADSRAAPPAPPWVTLPGIAFQGCGTFVMPFVIGFIAALFFEVSEVAETRTALSAITAVVLTPILLVQSIGLILKSRRDILWYRARRELTLNRLLDIVYAHLRVVTLRGWTLLLLGCFLVVVALGVKWAQFGLMAVLALLLFYAVTGWTVFVSTFLVRRFDRMGRSQARITRQLVPAIVMAGDPVEEVLTCERVAMPWGYLLVFEDPNPVRLRTESRYVIGSEGRGTAEVRGRLRATPRGHYRVGPARLWYQDILGITRISVSSALTAELKVLPRMKTVEVVEAPRSTQQTPDILTRPHRQPTDDWFRFREYVAGDDVRRIHWGLSMRAGSMHVRQPETREIRTQQVILALDTWVPPGRALDAAHGADEILDGLVEAWLGIARRLIENGDRVTMVAALPNHEGDRIAVETLPVRPGETARWLDMGARARWQSAHDVADLLAEIGPNVHGVIVTGRFVPAPALAHGQSTTWLFLDPADALGPPDPHWLRAIVGETPFQWVKWLLRLPHPAGSEENALPVRVRDGWQAMQLWHARKRLRELAKKRAGAAVKELAARGDGVYRIDRKATHIRVIGLSAGGGSL